VNRKLTAFISLTVMLSAAVLLSGCATNFRGSGSLDPRDYGLSDFTRVDVSSAFKVDIVQGDSFRVTVTADDNAFRYIEVEKSGKTLRIGMRPNFSFRNTTLEAEVTMPKIEALTLSGATRGSLKGFNSTEDIRFNLSGACTLDGEIDAADATLDVSGASRVTLDGTAQSLSINGSGASNLDMAGFTVNDANVELSGASKATIDVKDNLDIELSGASSLTYSGDPKIGRQSVTGASHLRQR
jgi:hypothetical protein